MEVMIEHYKCSNLLHVIAVGHSFSPNELYTIIIMMALNPFLFIFNPCRQFSGARL